MRSSNGSNQRKVDVSVGDSASACAMNSMALRMVDRSAGPPRADAHCLGRVALPSQALPGIHPATTKHSQLMPQEQGAAGVSDGYARLSVGVEHIDDIIADIERRLAAAENWRRRRD